MPVRPEGIYHLILAVDDGWQLLEQVHLNNEQARPINLALTRLEDGTPAERQFVADGEAHHFVASSEDGESVRIDIHSTDNAGACCVDVYLSHGEPPTPGDHDYATTHDCTNDQSIFVTTPTPGDWYVTVIGCVDSGGYTIEAETLGLALASVAPRAHRNDGLAVLTVLGAGFDRRTGVELVGSSTLSPDEVSVDSYNQMTATFDLDGVTPGSYDLRATKPDLPPSVLTDAVEVIGDQGESLLETELILPGWVGRHAVATIWVEYANVGEVAMPAPLLIVDGTDRVLMTLDANRVVKGFWTSAQPDGFSDTVMFLAGGELPGLLQPGESGRVPVYYTGLLQPWDFGDDDVEFGLSVIEADNSEPVLWEEKLAALQPPEIPDEAWTIIAGNLVAEIGSTWGDYVTMLSENAFFLNRLGQRVGDVRELFTFELEQAQGLTPLEQLEEDVDVALPAPGLPLLFSRSYRNAVAGRWTRGPFGYGWLHHWQLALTEDADGTVRLTDGGQAVRRFQPDSRGGYFSPAFDGGRLQRLPGGGFLLREQTNLTVAFTANGSLDNVEDSSGNLITAEYTGELLTGLSHSSGQAIEIAYNTAGLIEQLTDHRGRTTRFTYDPADEHLVSVEDQLGRTTTYGYASAPGAADEHALTAATGPDGVTRSYIYDERGRLEQTYLGDEEQAVRFSYDRVGTVVATDALGGTRVYGFDHRGMLARVADAEGQAHRRELISTSDEAATVRTIRADGLDRKLDYLGNRLVGVTDELGRLTRLERDRLGRVSVVEDALGSRVQLGRDGAGNLLAVQYPDSTVARFTYASSGLVSARTNRRGRTTGLTRNADGLVTAVAEHDGARTDLTYDDQGRLTTRVAGDGTTTLGHDVRGLLEQIAYPGGRTLAFTYDAAGRRTRSEDQLGRAVQYLYDDHGRLTSVTDGEGQELVRYHLDAAGRVERQEMGNGTSTTYARDTAGRITEVVNRGPGDVLLSSFAYRYDDLGRCVSVVTADGVWSYGHDAVGQLISARFDSGGAEPPDVDIAYVYDAMGNRVETVVDGETVRYTSGGMNRYASVADVDYRYDADGNLVSRREGGATLTYGYDDSNRLISMATPTESWGFAYDAFGQRSRVTRDGQSVHQVLDPMGRGNVVGEYDDAGAPLASYVHAQGLVARIDATGEVAYYLFDGLGNVVGLTDETGTVVNRYHYDPFGRMLHQEETLTQPFQYMGVAGVMRTGEDLYYMRARYYMPELGRFVSEDPADLVTGEINAYAYAFNDPIRHADPMGTWPAPSGTKLVRVDNPDRDDPTIRWTYLGAFREVRDESSTAQPDRRRDEPTPATPGQPVPGVLSDEDCAMYGLPPGSTGNYWRDMQLRHGSIEKGMFDRVWDRIFGSDDKPPPVPDNPRRIGGGQTGTVQSRDPNEKVGPVGHGDVGWVAGLDLFSYRVHFENDAEASAPAQQVDITDQLDPDLDWNSFEVTGVGFGDHFIAVPPGKPSFEAVVPMTYLEEAFDVHVQVGIDRYTGEVTARFTSVDPKTGVPPDVSVGFLPPEDGTGLGQGYFSYVVRPRPDRPHRTEIRNVAVIVFDLGEVIATNQIDPHDPGQGTDPLKECPITFDREPPSSSVVALPATSASPVLVSWDGTDDDSGIGRYDIRARIEGGAWGPWLEGVTTTSGHFPGEAGTTYQFHAIAIDRAGNRELKAPAVEAFTRVIAGGDRDGDGMPDDWELAGGLDPDEPGDAALDLDGDGLLNLAEFLHGTLPGDADSDDDGMPDGWEVAAGLDPTIPGADGDLDQDGFSDVLEYLCNTLPDDNTSVPAAPVADAGDPQVVTPGTLVELNGSGSSDPDGPVATYLWEQLAGATVALSDPAVARPTFPAPQVGPGGAQLVFVLTVADGCGLTAADETEVLVAEENRRPEAVAGEDQTVNAGAVVTLDGRGSSDPNADPLLFAWTQLEGEPVSLDDLHADTPSFNAPAAPDDLVFELVVSDGVLASLADTTRVAVISGTNGVPVASAGVDQAVEEGAVVALDGSGASDPDGDAITFHWSQESGTAVMLSDRTVSAPTFTAPEIIGETERLVFKLVVNDGQANSLPDEAAVVVHALAGADGGVPDADAGTDGGQVGADGGASGGGDGGAELPPDDGCCCWLTGTAAAPGPLAGWLLLMLWSGRLFAGRRPPTRTGR